MRKLRIEPIEYSKEEREIQYQEYLKSMNRMESYDEFKGKVYANLVAYKEENITRECGHYKGVEYREFLPESYWENELPSMLYPGIIATVSDIQKSIYKYKPHIFANKHVASSQTACVNLFVPILESPEVDQILMSLEACPKDFKHVAKDQLYHGYRFEFWDSTDEKSKGLLGDHSKQAGTDSDVAIAYYNTKDELCLWLIEHKLTEQEFTTCGAYRSRGNNEEGKKHCRKCSMGEILDNPDLCYYHHVSKYNYWNIMRDGAANFFSGAFDGKGCPFRGGMNQLWRNQLLAMTLEKSGAYRSVSFSVVHHPDNHFLDSSMKEFSILTDHSPKFNSFTSDKLVHAAAIDTNLKEWIQWYCKVYYGERF